MLDRFDMAAHGMSETFGAVGGVATQVGYSIENVAALTDEYNNSLVAAGLVTDNWTLAIGNYDKSALEAIHTTEELVEMGIKSEAALEKQKKIYQLCEQSITSLNSAIEGSIGFHSDFNTAIKKVTTTMKELSKSESIAIDIRLELSGANIEAAVAMQELEAAQRETQAAMENYNTVLISVSTNLSSLESATARACHASVALAKANGKASDSTGELSKATEQATEGSKGAGESAVSDIQKIAEAFAEAGITSIIKDIADTTYEMVNAFSEAENTVVLATGAAGAALDELMQSTMDAYATAKNADLSSTAGAIGEINTRMKLTGENLTDVTGKFLDFSSITGTDVVGSVQNVTKIMNKWGVEGKDVESVLDRLAYAGQISGVSVDNLSNNLITGAASFQEIGLSLDSTISMLAQFELYGMSGTTAITAIRTAISNFSKEGLDAETALQSVIVEIANMKDAADATALAVDTFGSRAGVDMSNAIRSGELSIDTFTKSLEIADGTLENTATTAQTLEQKWQQASNNIKAAFTTAVEPTISAVSSSFAEFFDGIGDYLNEHPKFTKAITAIAVGLGTIVVAATAVAVVIPAITAFGVALNTALGPIGWIALAITGVVAAGTALAAMFSESVDVSEDMTMSTREQHDKLQELNDEYDRTCERYGKTSEQAGELALQISQLEDNYNNTAETIGEFRTRIDEMGEAIDNRLQTFNEAVTASDKLYDSSITLASQLFYLSNQSDISGASFNTMSGIVDKLNSNYGNLGLTIDETTGKLNYSMSDLYDFISGAAEEQKQAAAMEGLVGALGKYEELRETYTQASQDAATAWNDYEALEEKWQGEHPILKNIASGAEMNWSKDLGVALDKFESLSSSADVAGKEYSNMINEIKTYCKQLGYTDEETEKFISEMERSVGAANGFAEQMGETTEETVSFEDAAKTAFSGVEEDVIKLVDAYGAAYEAARSSVDSTIGLFDTMSLECETSTQDMITALGSQTDYLNSYTENLRSAAAYGLDDGLIASLSDGSEESAAYLDTILQKIGELGGSTDEARAFIDEMNTSFADVQTAKDTFAKTVADMQTNFTEEMDKIEKTMQETIEGMGLDAEASQAATLTMQAYIDAINASKSGAVAAADQVVSAVEAALNRKPVTTPAMPKVPTTISLEANARGTTNAGDIFLAGEEGPEIIIGKGGSTVFPTEETEKIMDSLERPLNIVPRSPAFSTGNDNQPATDDKRHIVLELAGSGAIAAGSQANKETILNVLQEKIKPILMNIIQTEMYEEGKLSYDY